MGDEFCLEDVQDEFNRRPRRKTTMLEHQVSLESAASSENAVPHGKASKSMRHRFQSRHRTCLMSTVSNFSNHVSSRSCKFLSILFLASGGFILLLFFVELHYHSPVNFNLFNNSKSLNILKYDNCDSLILPLLNANVSREEYESANRLFKLCRQEKEKEKSKLIQQSSNVSQYDESDSAFVQSFSSSLQIDKQSNKQNDASSKQKNPNNRKPPAIPWKIDTPTAGVVSGINPSGNSQNPANIQKKENALQKSSHSLPFISTGGLRDDVKYADVDEVALDKLLQKERHVYPNQRELPTLPSHPKVTQNEYSKSEMSPILKLRRDMLREYGTWYGCDNDPTIRAMKGHRDVNRKPHTTTDRTTTGGFLQTPSKGKTNGKVESVKSKKPDSKGSTKGDLPMRLPSYNGHHSANGTVDQRTRSKPNENEDQPNGFLQTHGISPIATPPYRFGLLFMINKELRHPKLWASWLDHAYAWSLDLYQRRTGPYSAVVDEPFVPLFDLHVHFMGQGGGLYTSLKNVWRKWGLIAVEDSLNEVDISKMSLHLADDPRLKLPQIFQDAIIPAVHCGWGDLNPCEHQLLKYGLRDSSTNGFVFISESTVPAKPFRFIYDEYQQNPRSRFFFSNVNLPLVRKHHQWIVLSRQHAARLIDHPEKWTCNSWLVHHYPHWHVIGNFAASDEYLPFYAISDMVGIDTVMLEVNSGRAQDLRVFNNTYQVHGNRNFRHTWLCWWELPDYIDSEPCGTIGEYSTRLSSPVTYYKVFSQKFRETVIQNRNVWFARKFEKDCIVQLISQTPSTSRPANSEDEIEIPRREDQQDNDIVRRFIEVPENSSSVDNNDEQKLLIHSDKVEQQQRADRTTLLEDWLINILLNDDYFSTLPLHVYND